MFINVCLACKRMKDMSKYYHQQAENVKQGNQDQYSTNKPLDVSLYKQQVQTSTLKYAAHDGENLQQFLAKLKLYIDLGHEKNARIHIDPPKGAWYQHRNPAGCFCCEDQNMIWYMYAIMEIIKEKYPKFIIK